VGCGHAERRLHTGLRCARRRTAGQCAQAEGCGSRKTAHQLQAPLFLGIWAKQGSKGVKYDAENTGYGFRSEAVWDTYISAQPTSCQMKRPG
jgi:hypothetical protein